MRQEPQLWFHVDMDAFFAAVEQRDHPEYRGKPLMVGALPGRRGVISTCSYEARVFGVHSAMPVSEAYRLCPAGIFIPPDIPRYLEASNLVMEVLGSYTPGVLQVSIDEAYLDMKGTGRLWGTPDQAASLIKKNIREATGLTASIGVASNKFCAKLASDFQKPDGLTVIAPGQEEAFIGQLPLRKLWGIGAKTVDRLEHYGFDTIRKIRDAPLERLGSILGRAAGQYLYNIVRGLDPGIYEGDPSSHSISNEITFEHDIAAPDQVDQILLGLAIQVFFRLRETGLASRVLFLKLRLDDFTTMSIQKKIPDCFASIEAAMGVARELLDRKWNRKTPLRLIGLGFAELFLPAARQGELFELETHRQAQVESAVLDIRKRFPGTKITKARIVDSPLNEGKKNS